MNTPELMVVCVETGDRGYAEDERGMLQAARCFIREARHAGHGKALTTRFYVDGQMVIERKGAI